MKKILIIGLLLAIVGAGVGFMVYNKPHQNMQSATPDFKMTAAELFSDFETNENNANAKYLDKVIELNGTIQSVSSEENKVSITLDAGGMLGGVICQLDELSEHKRTSFQAGEAVQVKGLCTGMLMDVVLVRCVEL